MQRRRLFIVSVCLAAGLAASPPASARGLDKRFEFGRIALGAPVNKIPRWAVKGDCRTAPSGLGACGFYDADGIDYDIFDYSVCEKTFYVSRQNIKAIP